MAELSRALARILDVRMSVPTRRSVLVAISGIDACGKGYLTARLAGALAERGVRVAVLGVDGWLNLPHVRFDPRDPAEHFYRHAIRFPEMFDRLVLPLRDRRSIRVVADFAEETAPSYRPYVHEHEDVDVMRELRDRYDLSLWIDCGFDTARHRAVARSQEGLPPEDTIRAYRTIYFPAQEIHFRRDDPRAAATVIVDNETDLPPRRDLD